MKICKARITQCSGDRYWYRNFIGQEVFAIRQPVDSDLGFRMVFVGVEANRRETSYFNVRDLDVIEEFDGDVVERVTTEVIRRKVGADNTALVGPNAKVRGRAALSRSSLSTDGLEGNSYG